MFNLYLYLTGKTKNVLPTLLSWRVVHERMPWNIILLLGGGFALAAGSEVKTHVHCVFYCKALCSGKLNCSGKICPQISYRMHLYSFIYEMKMLLEPSP